MVRPSTQIFIYPADGKGAFAPVSAGMKLESLLGSTLAGLMNLSDDYTSGLQLVRLRFGATTIVAHKRLHDIKVTLTTYHKV